MTSRPGTFRGSLNLVCAMTFVFLTYVTGSDAQTSSRRSEQRTPTPSSPLDFSTSQTQSQTLPARQTIEPAVSPIAVPAQARVAQANPLESPMARELRKQLNQQRSFLTGAGTRPNRSRTLYDLRKQAQEQDSQTVEELLAEMDRRPAQSLSSPSTLDQDPPWFTDSPGNQTADQNPDPIEPAVAEQPEENRFRDSQDVETWNQSTSEESDFELTPEFSSDPAQPLVSQQSLPPDDLAFFELQAINNHPTLNASAARILTAQNEAVQAGLRPNPNLGLFIDEAGNSNDPGLWGAYLQRKHIRGNKLALGQAIKNREANVLEVEFETQVIKIKTDVRTAFYKLLIAKEKMALIQQLLQTQEQAVDKSNLLFKAGETPRTDVLQTELQLQRTKVLMSQLQITMENAWRELASVVGDPELEPREVRGDLNPIVEPVSFEQCRQHILSHSPELQSAQAEMERIRCTIQREIAETIPDYQSQLTVGRDSNTNHFYTGLQIQFPLQIHDQNQGNIAAAKTRLVAAQNDSERIKLDLSKRLAVEYRQYESALTKTNMYRNQLLPKSKQTLELLEQGYPSEVSFLQLLTAQQAVIDITLEYLDTLNLVWQSRLKIEGLLLDNSLSR